MDQAMREAKALSSPQSPAPLEHLPVDILVEILQVTARSTPDLHALICASPVVHRVFLSAKRSVLLALLDWHLGPAFRDAVAATLLAPARLGEEEAGKAIQQYALLPRGVGAHVLARDLSGQAIGTLVKTNHTVQFLIDEFAARRTALAKIHPNAAGPLTPQERWRLAQALLRHQFLARLQPSQLDAFRALFKPWEISQLCDIHSFVCGLLTRVLAPRRNRPRLRLSASFFNLRGLFLDSEEDAILRDLRAVHREFLKDGTDRETEEVVSAEFDSFRFMPTLNSMGIYFGFLAAGPLPAQRANYRVPQEARGLRDDLYRREDAMPPLFYLGDHDDASPPFGWVDAHDGLDCQRWGQHVHRVVPPPGRGDYTNMQQMWMCWRLTQWRWLGFAFWDKCRVEALKSGLPVYSTGWLAAAPPSNEHCKKEIRGLPLAPGSIRPLAHGVRRTEEQRYRARYRQL